MRVGMLLTPVDLEIENLLIIFSTSLGVVSSRKNEFLILLLRNAEKEDFDLFNFLKIDGPIFVKKFAKVSAIVVGLDIFLPLITSRLIFYLSLGFKETMDLICLQTFLAFFMFSSKYLELYFSFELRIFWLTRFRCFL